MTARMAGMPRMTVSTPAGDREVDQPEVEQVVAAIRSLDGNGEVGLGDPPGVWLGIAGGPHRYFVGYTNPDAGLTLQARATEPSGNDIEAVIGGQPTTLSAAYLVPVELATAVALHFLETGEASPSVLWDR